MSAFCFYAAGRSPALMFAINALQEAGCVFSQMPDETVTHLLLPVPSMESPEQIKGGQNLYELLQHLPEDITIIGGNLPELQGYKVIDLLKDDVYVAENASITAYCAITIALGKLPVTLKGCKCLVIGWGRIGKCLARLLKDMGAIVTVAARKAADRAMAEALGFASADTADIHPESYRVIFNTAPELILPQCHANALKIDLASKPGITGPDVIWARGLPGKDTPESAGYLMAQRILYYI